LVEWKSNPTLTLPRGLRFTHISRVVLIVIVIVILIVISLIDDESARLMGKGKPLGRVRVGLRSALRLSLICL